MNIKNILLFFLVIMLNNFLYSEIPEIKPIFDDENVMEFIKAVKNGNYKKAEEMIKSGVDIEYKGYNEITPLYFFFLNNDYKSFKKMLEFGANPNVYPRGVGFDSLIRFTTTIKDDRFFKLLLKYNVDVNYTPQNNVTLIVSVLLPGIDIKYLKMLLDYGINIQPYEANLGSTPTKALRFREYKKVILLFEYGAVLDDTKVFKVYKGETTAKQDFIEELGSHKHKIGSQLYNDQLELVRYLKDKLGYNIRLKY